MYDVIMILERMILYVYMYVYMYVSNETWNNILCDLFIHRQDGQGGEVAVDVEGGL